MLYAILAYHPAGVIEAMPPEQGAAMMEKMLGLQQTFIAEGKLGPAVRLDFTAKAVTLRGQDGGMVIDGPFAETKEHLLGFYVLNCETQDEAVEIARKLQQINKTAIYEIRPVPLYVPGASVQV